MAASSPWVSDRRRRGLGGKFVAVKLAQGQQKEPRQPSGKPIKCDGFQLIRGFAQALADIAQGRRKQAVAQIGGDLVKGSAVQHNTLARRHRHRRRRPGRAIQKGQLAQKIPSLGMAQHQLAPLSRQQGKLDPARPQGKDLIPRVAAFKEDLPRPKAHRARALGNGRDGVTARPLEQGGVTPQAKGRGGDGGQGAGSFRPGSASAQHSAPKPGLGKAASVPRLQGVPQE